jgi:quercetin dioxygenase-like cupin family protein
MGSPTSKEKQMKPFQSRLSHLTVGLVCLATGLSLFATNATAAKPKAQKFITQDEVKYEEILPNAVSFGTVMGNRTSGAHGTFVTIKKGAATPLHVHGNSYNAVVIKGKVENPIEGVPDSKKSLGPGSFYQVPANAKHVTRCVADSAEDCMTFFWQSTKFDFLPVK